MVTRIEFFFARAPMHCVPAMPKAPACWEHLRAGLHPTEPKTGSSGAPGLRRKDETLGLPGMRCRAFSVDFSGRRLVSIVTSLSPFAVLAAWLMAEQTSS